MTKDQEYRATIRTVIAAIFLAAILGMSMPYDAHAQVCTTQTQETVIPGRYGDRIQVVEYHRCGPSVETRYYYIDEANGYTNHLRHDGYTTIREYRSTRRQYRHRYTRGHADFRIEFYNHNFGVQYRSYPRHR